ncbi:MAG: branched-chain amino acid ABC transporter permease [Alphaproteobacteria bacterium]|nr:branched-chain amino acid ABC transporter permease [Alphaproteobacteria bacterium]
MLHLELLVQGVVQGSIYALIALGLTLVYGLLRVLHVAHAAMFTLGAYLGVVVTNATGSLPLGCLAATLLCGFAGVALYRLCYEPILHRPPFVALIASIGLYIAAEEVFRIVFGEFGLSYQAPPLQSRLAAAGIGLKAAELVVILASAAIIAALAILQRRTRLGIACIASVADPAMAQSAGIDLRRVRDLVFFVGSALAGYAGVMVGLLNNLVEPGLGAVPSYKALAIIVLGGLGSTAGALAASMVLGIVESFGTIHLGWLMDRNAIAFAFLIAVLMVRPHGLFARR